MALKEPRSCMVRKFTFNLHRLVEAGMYSPQEALKERGKMFKAMNVGRKPRGAPKWR